MIKHKINIKHAPNNNLLEAVLYPILVLAIMWISFLLDRFFELDLYKYGIKPRTLEGLKGILFMPFIHGQKDFSHIFNNSIPLLILLSTLLYFYRKVAAKVIFTIWFGTGFLLWYIATNSNSYHIGMSGIIYGLFGFLLVSGFLIKNKPLQAISLFVAFVYGSLIWGIFPTEEAISWEGHLAGLIIGIFLAFVFRKKGPPPKKYQYELEEERELSEREKIWEEKIKEQQEETLQQSTTTPFTIVYDYIEKEKKK